MTLLQIKGRKNVHVRVKNIKYRSNYVGFGVIVVTCTATENFLLLFKYTTYNFLNRAASEYSAVGRRVYTQYSKGQLISKQDCGAITSPKK